jgi:hypothetical protein
MRKFILTLTLLLATASANAFTTTYTATVTTNRIGNIPTDDRWVTIYNTAKCLNSCYSNLFGYSASTRIVLTANKAMTLQCYMVISTNSTSPVVANGTFHAITTQPFYIDIVQANAGKKIAYTRNPVFTVPFRAGGYKDIWHSKTICRVNSAGGKLTADKGLGNMVLTITR